eukprot:1298064-Alexandrium_andersonii.AAC.1
MDLFLLSSGAEAARELTTVTQRHGSPERTARHKHILANRHEQALACFACSGVKKAWSSMCVHT